MRKKIVGFNLFRFIIRWSFYTEGHDIKFGINKMPTADVNKNLSDPGQNIDWEIPLRKIASHQNEEIGFIECLANYTCNFSSSIFFPLFFHVILYIIIFSDEVVFDNSYSVVRNKKLSYRVAITPPVKSNILSVDEE